MHKNRWLPSLVAAICVLSLVAVGCAKELAPVPPPAPAPTPAPAPAPPAPAPPAEVMHWRMQGVWSPTGETHTKYYIPFCQRVEEKSGGRIKIEPYGAGAIVGPFETFDAVREGAIEIGGGCSAYNAKVIPVDAPHFILPFSFPTHTMTLDFMYNYKDGAPVKIVADAYKEVGLHYLGSGMSPYILATKFPIRRIEDFEGKKFRATPPWTYVVKALGGMTVGLAYPEQYLALQRGTIDGSFFDEPGLENYKLKEVVDYVMWPRVAYAQGCEIYMNLDVYNKLPDDLKEVLDEAGKWSLYKYCDHVAVFGEECVKSAQAAGVEVLTLSDPELLRFREACMPIWDTMAEKSERSTAYIELAREYLTEEGLLK